MTGTVSDAAHSKRLGCSKIGSIDGEKLYKNSLRHFYDFSWDVLSSVQRRTFVWVKDKSIYIYIYIVLSIICRKKYFIYIYIYIYIYYNLPEDRYSYPAVSTSLKDVLHT